MNVSLPAGKLFANEFPAASLPMPVTCEFHPWMACHVLIQNHPYATLSDITGAFEIPMIPKGTWRLRIWHEVLGELKLSQHPSIQFDSNFRLIVDRPLIDLGEQPFR